MPHQAVGFSVGTVTDDLLLPSKSSTLLLGKTREYEI